MQDNQSGTVDIFGFMQARMCGASVQEAMDAKFVEPVSQEPIQRKSSSVPEQQQMEQLLKQMLEKMNEWLQRMEANNRRLELIMDHLEQY
jgi:predicted ribosome quality control (RQC) complex YloA/Tae2 family protein